ncbi:MAG TPA: flagellar type III secretion system pore protein FliP [bacterium]|nr:flagellar type III secretion system pore protein FliP [bacterium]HPQ18241.1 flagellar type III secretion system pore protein FliP [bacterium]
MRKKIFLFLIILFFVVHNLKAAPIPIPKINIGVEEAKTPDDVALSLQILFLLTILSLAPAILLMLTALTRIYIFLLFIQRALSLQQMPPNQVIVALALFLTFFVMAPTIKEINDNAVQPFMNKKIPFGTALDSAMKPLRTFMFKQVDEKNLALFFDLAKLPRPKNRSEVPNYILIPAFVLGEITIAFKMGLLIYIPFIVVDMIVASVLMAMGMMMLPPVMISIPIKLLFFIMVDGWNLLVYYVVKSFS